MIKTLKDFREALEKMMEERGYRIKRAIQADTRTDDILISSVAAPDTVGEISVGAIFIAPRSWDKRGQK